MMERGISDKTVSRLKFLRKSKVFDDGVYALVVETYLDSIDSGKNKDERLKEIKLLQMFSNPELYNTVYEDEIKQEQARKNKEVQPSQDAMKNALELMNRIDNTKI